MPKRSFFLFCFFSFSIALFGGSLTDHREPNGIHVAHYTIATQIKDLNNDTLFGWAELIITPKSENTKEILLDFFKYQIDSILVNRIKNTNYQYNDTLLNIRLLSTLNYKDTIPIRIYYHGKPSLEPYAWGGVHLDRTIAYNLGVAFEAYPHSFGRSWFPCIDDFTERATYDFQLTCPKDLKAICTGNFLKKQMNYNGSCTWFWQMKNTIPSYLASFAVSDYIELSDSCQLLNGNIKTSIYTQKSDYYKAITDFKNLKITLQAFEKCWGAYPWSRVGFVQTNKGSMEHPTNIALPNDVFTGDMSYEAIYYHELAHSWFGDLVTCKTDSDMWLNEGWATYNEVIFEEMIYGEEAAKAFQRRKHLNVLQKCHLEDGAYYSLTNIPNDKRVYGETVYQKGSGVVHTLRGYLGDSLFFGGVKSYLSKYAFNSASTADLEKSLSEYSGIDLKPFFDTWVYSPGFIGFNIDSTSIETTKTGTKATVYIRQKLSHHPQYANKNKVSITFIGFNWQQETRILEFSGKTGIGSFEINFVPQTIIIDKDNQMADANTDVDMILKSNGYFNLSDVFMKINISHHSDSAYLHIDHHFTAPDSIKKSISGLKIHPTRYWEISGIFPKDFKAEPAFRYGLSEETLDDNFLSEKTKKIVLLYRKNAGDDWKIIPSSKNGNSQLGYIIGEKLMIGEYALGKVE